ncbi:YqaJ viral recombinase family protein [Paraburkholderia bryophila]|uniref:YqaJ viral recombinase family nuclease n=1 Tax=Paraburkholderia bryophila TaxID=420952 RepID=UPI002349DE21|nr:YqaJ viral recombinase family protein [Paraburkholderia bryophila]WCM19777.1 YqaJ viral recombinase family protein [Paraburkholderia bryophila]
MSLPETAGRGRKRPALRLVETKDLPRTDWLEVRKSGIGGSDAAAAVGFSPYQSRLELWLTKTGRDASLPKPDVSDTTDPVYWGTLLEPIVAASYSKQTGNRVRKINAVLQHPTIPFMLANIDREVIGVPGVQILECKTAGEFGARLWRDGPPEYVQIQVQHQLAVTGKSAADVAVLLCGQKLEVHRIERDDELIARLIPLEAAFWRYVETDTPPSADGSESADRALRCLYRGTGGTVDFTDDRRLSSLFTDLVAIRAGIEQRETQEAVLRQTLIQAMGEADRAIFETGSVSFKRSRDSSGVDFRRLLAEHPEVASQYALTKPGSRRFFIST